MAKYCSNCGNEINENAVICVKCGCSITQTHTRTTISSTNIIDTISQRIKTNGIIWLVIACVQIILAITGGWWLLIVGGLNLYSSIQDLNYSKSVSSNPVGIVEKIKPITNAVVALIYNLLIGGIIGVAGSIYYLIAVRGYVLENEQAFLEIENQNKVFQNQEV